MFEDRRLELRDWSRPLTVVIGLAGGAGSLLVFIMLALDPSVQDGGGPDATGGVGEAIAMLFLGSFAILFGGIWGL